MQQRAGEQYDQKTVSKFPFAEPLRRSMRRVALAAVITGALALTGCGTEDPEVVDRDTASPAEELGEDSEAVDKTASTDVDESDDTADGADAAGSGWGGAWRFEDSGDVSSATIETDGASLSFVNDEVWGQSVLLHADDLTSEVIDTEVCRNGCSVTVQIDGEEWENLASRPETENEPHLSLREPRELWQKVVGAEGPLTVIAADGYEYEFDVTGASPEFF